MPKVSKTSKKSIENVKKWHKPKRNMVKMPHYVQKINRLKIVEKKITFKTWWSGLGKITQKCDFLQGYGVLGCKLVSVGSLMVLAKKDAQMRRLLTNFREIWGKRIPFP
jgi:hypothetical protein